MKKLRYGCLSLVLSCCVLFGGSLSQVSAQEPTETVLCGHMSTGYVCQNTPDSGQASSTSAIDSEYEETDLGIVETLLGAMQSLLTIF